MFTPKDLAPIGSLWKLMVVDRTLVFAPTGYLFTTVRPGLERASNQVTDTSRQPSREDFLPVAEKTSQGETPRELMSPFTNWETGGTETAGGRK
jgi:hypothetical protein